MVSLLSNDKILPQVNDRNSSAAEKRSGTGLENNTGSPSATPANDTVELSGTGRLVSQEVNSPRSGNVTNQEQAMTLALRIKETIQSSASSALKAHGQIESGQLTSLLEASAA
ncbi:hypothetical protein [Sedimenticola selenatireducens]|uniref:Uncharacterized protein n=1 Tax=Sedimenticola selenatireducens TaxID=191960 RepID=A0A557SD10_9GAMM|nr:hypothetical protein [Sedimenticola selenatireducens]TVO75302.1 hypothetical protein FHP88_09875 [Sedimenticola selenatireducens]TVT66845.1 MAG: hypothetical protein FHK78_00485 [Sedimenticola selenatireducens]